MTQKRKGIILAGGAGTRLHPLTQVVSKQLLPVYNKPMIYYPLSLLMFAKIREVLIISTPTDLPMFRRLFEDGSRLGMQFEYAEQPHPGGLAQAFHIGSAFLNGAPACLVLGDNIFFGASIAQKMRDANDRETVATVFGYPVRDPKRYGIVEFDANGNVLSIEEKPSKPKSQFAIPGIYFYPDDVSEMAKQVEPSARGELEITTLNQMYLDRRKLRVELLGRGIAWFDTGTHESLLQASCFVEAIEERQGLMVACLEEIALTNEWIDKDRVAEIAASYGKSSYGEYLKGLPH